MLAFLQALRALPEEGDDALDRLLHAVEFRKGRIHADGAVHEDAPKASIFRRIHHLRLADRGKQPFMGRGIHEWVGLAPFQVLRHRHHRLAPCLETARIGVKQVSRHRDPADRR